MSCLKGHGTTVQGEGNSQKALLRQGKGSMGMAHRKEEDARADWANGSRSKRASKTSIKATILVVDKSLLDPRKF